jgi:hypothetical protein
MTKIQLATALTVLAALAAIAAVIAMTGCASIHRLVG